MSDIKYKHIHATFVDLFGQFSSILQHGYKRHSETVLSVSVLYALSLLCTFLNSVDMNSKARGPWARAGLWARGEMLAENIIAFHMC